MSRDLSIAQINSDSKVLIIYPHPDDETFMSFTLIYRLVKAGIACKLICLTKGGNSTLKFHMSDNDLKNTRESEFINVMRLLKLESYEMLDLDDGNLESLVELWDILTDSIKSFKPTHVVTYEPCGVYGHPDHIIVSRIVTALQKNFYYKLLYATVAKNYRPSKGSILMAKNPSEIKPLIGNICLKLNIKEYLSKLKALKFYKSQIKITHNFLHNLSHLLFLTKEYYYLNSSQRHS